MKPRLIKEGGSPSYTKKKVLICPISYELHRKKMIIVRKTSQRILFNLFTLDLFFDEQFDKRSQSWEFTVKLNAQQKQLHTLQI